MNYCPSCGHRLPEVAMGCSTGEKVLTGKQVLNASLPMMSSPLGLELVDIIKLLRSLGTPEEQVTKAVWSRLEK